MFPDPKNLYGSFASRSEAKSGVWHNVPPCTTTQGYRDYAGIPTENNVGIVFPDPENLKGSFAGRSEAYLPCRTQSCLTCQIPLHKTSHKANFFFLHRYGESDDIFT